MKVIADLQLHSKYSRATSQKMEIGQIWQWARVKGIGLVATGDWTHPLWVREIKANLVEDGRGLLKLKNDRTIERYNDIKKNIAISQYRNIEPVFLLATEISSIYTQGGKQRRIHNLIWAPKLSVVEKINAELTRRGCNLSSDGRPIIGLTSQELVKLVLGADESCLIIPAHAWTPWFSLYGSKSGFDSIEECFGDYSKYIYAIETGLSSDPAMNWRIKDLDKRAILSFSDAHSGPKLGREATVFELEELSYNALREAILASAGSAGVTPSASAGVTLAKLTENKIACTFEFYPEEGKYHYTGHRLCGIRQNPEETKKKGVTCSVCGKPLTVGVMHRVEELAKLKVKSPASSAGRRQLKVDRYGVRWIYHPENKKPPYVNLVPLVEILGEVLGTASTSQKVVSEYKKLTEQIGPEFYILLKADLRVVGEVGGERVAEALRKVRTGEIFVEPGYDGVFGKVRIWGSENGEGVKGNEGEKKEQLGLF